MNSIKLTRSEACAILYCALGDMPDTELNPLLDNLRDAGFIVKTKVEEAEEAYNLFTSTIWGSTNYNEIFTIVNKLWFGIKELKIVGPIGMYRCPECGNMVVAGCAHPDYDRLDNLTEEDIKVIKGDKK